MKLTLFILTALMLSPLAALHAAEVPAFKSRLLIGAGEFDEGIRIMDESLKHFDFGNAGMDGVHAAAPSAAILARLR